MAMLILKREGYVGDDEDGGDGGDGKDGGDGGGGRDGDLLQHGLAHIAGNHFGKVRRKELRELTTSAPSYWSSNLGEYQSHGQRNMSKMKTSQVSQISLCRL